MLMNEWRMFLFIRINEDFLQPKNFLLNFFFFFLQSSRKLSLCNVRR